MTAPLRTKIAVLTASLLAITAGSAVAAGLAQTADTKARTALVVAGAAASDRDGLATARQDAHVDLRVVRTNAEELGVTHMLAARGYDRVVVVGVDERTAVKPVRVKYPDTRFEAAASVDDALRQID